MCDDYSLPVDFVKRIDPTAPALGSARSLHLPTSHTAPSPLSTDHNLGSAGQLDNHQVHDLHHSNNLHQNNVDQQRSLKVIAGYSQPKDRHIEIVEECESNDQLCSSGKLCRR